MSDHVFDKQRWQAQSVAWQMGNIGSEVGRALRAKHSAKQKDATAAFYRGLDLIDATAEGMLAQKSPRVKEVLRAREEFCRAIVTDHEDPTLEQYFTQFAIAERLRSGR